MQQHRGNHPQLQQLHEHVLLLQQIQHRLVLQQAGVPELQNGCIQQQHHQEPHEHLCIQTQRGGLAELAREQPQRQQGEPHPQPQQVVQQQQLHLPSSSAHAQGAGDCNSAHVLETVHEVQQAEKEHQQREQHFRQRNNQQEQERFLLQQQQRLLLQQQLLLQLGAIKSPQQLNLAIHLVQRQLLLQRTVSSTTTAAAAAAAEVATDVPLGSTQGSSSAEGDAFLCTSEAMRIARQHAAYLAAAASANGQLEYTTAREAQPAAAAAAMSQLLGRQKLETAVQKLNAPAIRWWGARQLQEQQQLLLQVQQVVLLLQQQPDLQWLLLQDQELLGLLDTQPGLLILLLRNQKHQHYWVLRQQLLRGAEGLQHKQQQQQQLPTPLAMYAMLVSGASHEEQQQQQQVQQQVKALQHERQRLTLLMKQQLQLQQQRLQKHRQQQQQQPPLQPESQQPLAQQQQRPQLQQQQGPLLQQQQQGSPPPHEHQHEEPCWSPENWPSQPQESVHAADREEEHELTQQLTGSQADSMVCRQEQRLVVLSETHNTAKPSPGRACVRAQPQQQSQQEHELQPIQPQSEAANFSAEEARQQQVQQPKDQQKRQEELHQRTQQQPKQPHRSKAMRKQVHPYSYRSVPDVATEAEPDATTAAAAPSAAAAVVFASDAESFENCRRRCSRLKGDPPGPDLCSRQTKTSGDNRETSSSSSSSSSSSGDENRPPLQQRRRQQKPRGRQKNQPKMQQEKLRRARRGAPAAPAASASAAEAAAAAAEEAADAAAETAVQPVCLSQGSRGAAAASRATIAASEALKCGGKPKARGNSALAGGVADGDQLDEQQLQLLVKLLQDWCSKASRASPPPPADASASLVTRLTAAQPLLERLKHKQQQQSALLLTAEGHSEAVRGLCRARSAGMARLQHLLSWSLDQQPQQQHLPHRLLMSSMKTPETKDKGSQRPVQKMKRLSNTSGNTSSNSAFASLCGCVAVALHAEAALLILGIDPAEEMDLQAQDQQLEEQQHEKGVSLVPTAAACVKTHCRDTLMPLFSRQIEDTDEERSALGVNAAAATDAAAALQRLLEGLRHLWSVAVSLQQTKTFSMESFHLLAAGLCCIWGVRAFSAFSVAAAPLLRSAEGLLLLLFQFVPQLREPIIDGLMQQFAASADESCNQKAGGKHAAVAAAAAAAAAMDEEGEEVVAPQQVPAGAVVTAAHPVALLLLRLLQAACLPSEVYRHLEGSSFAPAPSVSLEKQTKHLVTRAEGAAAAAAATAKYIARRLINMAVGEEMPAKQQQLLLLPSPLRSTSGCLRAARRLVADLSLLTLSPSHPSSLLLLRAVGFTLLARLLRPDAAADHTQQQQQTALLSLLSALAPAVFAEPLPFPSVPLLQEQQQQQKQLSEAEQSDTVAASVARGSRSACRGPTQAYPQQQLRSRRESLEHGCNRSTAAAAAKPITAGTTQQVKHQQREACCDCASLKPHEVAGESATAAGPWVCVGCELRRSVALSLQEAIGRLRPSAWLSIAAAIPARSAGTTVAVTAAAHGIADGSLLLCVLDEPLTFRCTLLMHANANCSGSKPATSAVAPAAKGARHEQTPAAAAAAASAAAASSAASAMRLSHRRLLQQHSRAAMACLLLLLGGSSNKISINQKRTPRDSKPSSLKENRAKSSKADGSTSSRLLQLVLDIEWEATAAGDVGLLLPLSATAAAGNDIHCPRQQQQQQQLVVSIWRSLALSALQRIGDLLLHAIQVSAVDPRSSVRRAALCVLHACATWRPSLLQASSTTSNSGIALILPQALADSSPGVRERALALLDTALKQQQRDAVAALQRCSQPPPGDARREEQPHVAVSPWLEEIGGLLRFLRYVVLQETSPSVRQQALRVARGCAAAAPLGETARCCRSLLLEALAAAPDHPPTKAFITAALAADVVGLLAPKPLEKAAAAASEVGDAAGGGATQTPQKRRSLGLQGYGGSPLAAAGRGPCSPVNLTKAVRLLASLVAAAREHLEDTPLVLLLLPRMQQQLQQQLQQHQALEELAATFLDACLSEYLKCCCGVPEQQQQRGQTEQQQEQLQQLQQQEDSLLDPPAAGASLLQLAQELGLFCPRGLLQFVPHVAVLLRDNAALLQRGMSSSRSWTGEIELLAAAANHIRGAPYHMQQEMLHCVPAVLLLLETDPLLLQPGTTMLCRVSLQLEQEGVRDSLLDLLAVSLALIYSIKDRIYPRQQPQQQQEPQQGAQQRPQQDQQLQDRQTVVPMLQALQFASWAVACLASGLGIGATSKGSAAWPHTSAAASAAASANQQRLLPGAAACAASLLSDVPVALLMRRVAAHATDSKSAAAAAAAAAEDGAFSLQQCIFHLLCDALLLLQQHGGMTAVAWRSVCCFVRAAPSFLKSPRLGARLKAAIATASAATEKSSWGQHEQQQQQMWTKNASALDLPAALQALYGLVKGLQRDASPPGTADIAAAATAAKVASGGGKCFQTASLPSRRSASRPKSQRQQQQQQKQCTPPSRSRAPSVASASTSTAAAAAAVAITANLRQGLWTDAERAPDTHGSAAAGAATAQPSVCDYLHSLATYVRPMMDLLLPRQQQQQLHQQQRSWPTVNCSTATLILLLARTLQQLGLLYHSELVPQAAALLFCSSRTVARAASLLLQEALGGVSAASAAGRLQECLDSSLLLCIHRAAVDVTAAECLSLGSDNSSSKLLHLQEEGAAPVAALLLSPFTPVDPAAVSAFVAFFTKRGSSRGSPTDIQLGLVAQLRRFSSVEALACLAARLPPAAAETAGSSAAGEEPDTRVAAWIGSLPPSLAAVAADAAIAPWLQQTPVGLLPLLPAVLAALLHLRLVADVLLSIILKPSEAADAAAALKGVAVDCGAAVDILLHSPQQQQRQQQHRQGFHVMNAAEGGSDAAAVQEDIDSHECGDSGTKGVKQQHQQKRGWELMRQRGRRSSSSSSRSSSNSKIPPSRKGGVVDCGAAAALPTAGAAPGPSVTAAATAKKSPMSIRRNKRSTAPLPPAILEEKAAWRLFAAAASSQRHAVATLGRLWLNIVLQGDSSEGAAAENPEAATASEETRASLIREMVNEVVSCGNDLSCAERGDLAPSPLHRGARSRKRLQQQLQQQQQQQQQRFPPTWRRRKRRRFGVRKGEDPRDSDWARDVETSEPTAESDEDFTDN